MLATMAGIIFVARAWGKTSGLLDEQERETESIKQVLDNAKKIIQQDRVVSGNSDTGGMREKLSAALRRKRDS